VNGGVHSDFNSRVGKDIETVNGGITIKQSEVGGQHPHHERRHHDRRQVGGARRRVDREAARPALRQDADPARGDRPDASVQGTLRFDREVELFVHPTAKIGTVVGAKRQSWTDKLPPRARLIESRPKAAPDG
jgi:hypothetical protein